MAIEGAVTYELRDDDVAWLGLNRPHKRNAISAALLAEFEATVRRAQDEARALVVFGHGPCFSAGVDLAELRALEATEVFRGSRAWHAAFSLLRHGRIPVIAALHGATIGAGSNWPLPATSASPTSRRSSRCRKARAASMSAAALRCMSRGCSALRASRT